MAKHKSEKKAKEGKAVQPKPSSTDLKKSSKEKVSVISSKEILANGKDKKKASLPTAAKPPPPKPTISSDESSEDSSEDEAPKAPKPKPQTTTSKKKASSDDDSSDSSSEDEKSKVSQVKPPPKRTSGSSSDSSESSEDKVVPPKSATKSAITAAPKDVAKKPAATSTSSSEESSEDEAVSTLKSTPITPAARKVTDQKKTKAKPESSSPSSDASEDEDDNPAVPSVGKKDPTSEESDSDSSEEETPKAKVPSKASAQKVKTHESPSSSDSESEDSDEKEDVKMTDASAPVITAGKRKAKDDVSGPAKKVKVSTANGDANSGESKTLFVGQLSWNVDNDWLLSEFAEAGEIVSARVQMDRQSGRSRGFGYVEFSTAATAQKALEMFQGKEIDGRAIKLDISTPRQPNPTARAQQFGDTVGEPSDTLFVGNISWNTTEDALWEHFGQYGEVSSVRIPTDRESGKPKGFGYVQFSDVESAKKGFEGANGAEIDGRNIRLDYSQPRDSNASRGFGGRGRGGDRGGSRGFGSRGGPSRGGNRGRGDRGGRPGRGGGRPPRGGARTGAITSFEGRKMTFD